MGKVQLKGPNTPLRNRSKKFVYKSDLKHGGKVEHCHVRFSVMIDGKVELRQLVVRGEVGGLPRVLEQLFCPNVFLGQKLGSVGFILDDDPLFQEALFLGSHDKVVSLVLVVHDVFEVNAFCLVEVVEELLVEDESHAGNFLHPALGLCVLPDEVGGDRDGKLAAELLPLESVQSVSLPVGANQEIEFVLTNRMVRRRQLSPPSGLNVGRLDETLEPNAVVNLHTEDETHFEEDALKLPDRDVINGPSAKLAVKLFSSQASEVVDVVGPQVEDVVAAEPVSFFNDDHLCAEELSLNGCPEAAWAGTDNQDALTCTSLAPVVDFVHGSLVILGPECLSFPGFELGLDLWVEVGKFCWL